MASFHITYSTLKSSSTLCNSLIIRRGFTACRVIFNKPSSQAQGAPKIPQVKGLSAKVVHPANEPVGPGASKNTNYKNPEYFCYDKDSFFEAEVEMASYRCPQPSNKK
ncbi:nadh dehydrogenase [ubiquinone] flavoprotein 3 mitochondrial [Holotrichia oblita]|uniref:Nadh dehydrogenase [ubiquinone] flavoprotein 3 mitochondrial n=1 Tax=Holotrichia oblita TaxID=644536 RepID=A0ACB9T9Y0_HOLOL|nr:nadh dehydrogenase [ubiquinone] flavoprotein 3 mitochondrial [Holotrichia oblita]